MFNNLINWLVKKSKQSREDVIVGLIVGLIGGLIFGLIGGIIAGLIIGLILGLSTIVGSLLACTIIAAFQSSLFPWWILPIAAWVLMEAYFIPFDKAKPKKNENPVWFAAKRKGLIVLITSFSVVVLNGMINLGRKAIPYLKTVNWKATICFLGYATLAILTVALILLILWGYFKLNSLIKYKKVR